MWRKRASPAPRFRQPAPYNPISGQHAELGRHGILSRVAMMQVISADTHANYVVCRGYDPQTERFYDTLNVGKPYGVRGMYPYQIGEVYPAIKPRTQLGDTPGMAATSTGHPATLSEDINILTDENGDPIWWLLLDANGGVVRWGKLDGEMTPGSQVDVSLWQGTDGDWGKWDQDSGENWEDVYAPPLMQSGSISAGKWVLVEMVNGRKVVLEHQC